MNRKVNGLTARSYSRFGKKEQDTRKDTPIRMAYSYLRFSTPEQSKGDSTKRQTEAIAKAAEWCKQQGIPLDDTLRDPGVSAWKGKNASLGALSRFLDLVRKGKVARGSFLIIEHIDRLTRQKVRKALNLWTDILDAGITIVTVAPFKEYPPTSMNDPLGLIEPILYFAVNNEKSERLSDSLKKTWKSKREKRKPLTSWCAAWLRLSEDKERYELIPEKAKIVKLIVKKALEGYGDQKLCQWLHRNKIPPISDNPTWTTAYISKILKSPLLVGKYQPGTHHWHEVEVKGETVEKKIRQLTGEVWEGYVPRLISDEDFRKLRAKRLANTRNGGRTGENCANLFSKILFNAKDGQGMQRIVKDHPRLISKAFRNGLDGDTQSFPYAPFEEGVLATLMADLKPADLFGTVTDHKPDRTAELSAKLEDIEARLTILQSQMDGDVSGLPTIMKKVAEWEKKKANLLNELEKERAAQIGQGSEAEALEDIQALTKILEGEADDLEDVRMKLKHRLLMLVERMDVVIHGIKRSKWKRAHVQVKFKAGGVKLCKITAEQDTFIMASMDRDIRKQPLDILQQADAVAADFTQQCDEWKEARMKAKWAEDNAKRKAG
jgi:DNA invertase Pin-like site-specific DNA recombinase